MSHLVSLSKERQLLPSHAYALRLFLFSAFHIPTSEFLALYPQCYTL